MPFPANSWSRGHHPRRKNRCHATSAGEIHSKVGYQYLLKTFGVALTVSTFAIGTATTLVMNSQKAFKSDISDSLKALKSDLKALKSDIADDFQSVNRSLELIKNNIAAQQSILQLVQDDLAALAAASGKSLA